MRVITFPPEPARLNGVARVLAAFVSHLYQTASGNPKPDARQVARTLLLGAVPLGTFTTTDGDALLSALLDMAKEAEAQRSTPDLKGGAA